MASRTRRKPRNNPNRLYVLNSEDGSLLSLADDNEISIGGTVVATLQAGDRYDLAVTEGMIIDGTGSFIGSGEDGGAHFSYLPEYMKGKILQTTLPRGGARTIRIYPLEDGSVDVFRDNVLSTTITLTQGTVATYSFNANAAWRLNSTGYILATANAGVSDPHPFVWGADTIVGFASNSGRLSTLVEEAPTPVTHYGNGNNDTSNENGIESTSFVHSGTRSYEHPDSASHSVSFEGKRLFAHSYADSDGGASSKHLPTSLMAHTFGLPHGTEFVSFINRTGKPIRKYVAGALVSTFTPTKTNTDSRAWYSYRDGAANNTVNIAAGAIYVCDEKMHAVYQTRENSIYEVIDDETTLLPTDLDWKYAP